MFVSVVKVQAMFLSVWISKRSCLSLFVLLCRYPLPEEDFEIAIKAYEWPKKMVDILKEATTKVKHSHQDGSNDKVIMLKALFMHVHGQVEVEWVM
jgi:hypothetical protein